MEIFFDKKSIETGGFLHPPMYSIAANSLNLAEFVQQTFWGSYIALNLLNLW